MNNPYYPPNAVPTSTLDETELEKLRKIASAHRQVNLAVLFYLCMAPINTGLMILSEKSEWAYIPLVFVMLCVAGFGAISVYKLASIFHGKARAVIHATAMLVPLLGLILLVTNSQTATKLLQKNGIKVGLLGANPKSF